MKYSIIFIVLACFTLIIYGFHIKSENEDQAHKCIGIGTAGLFLVAMPLFLYKASKGKKMKDYLLTEENIMKMRDKEKKNTNNQ